MFTLLLAATSCTQSKTSSFTVTARGGVVDFPFPADNVRGRPLFDDPALAVRIRRISFDGRIASETASDAWPIGAVSTRSTERSDQRVYILSSEEQGDYIVIQYIRRRASGMHEWRQVRALARFSSADIDYSIAYPDGTESSIQHLRVVPPPMWRK